MTPLGETRMEFSGELGHEELPGIGSPVGTGGGDPVQEEGGSVSPVVAVVSSPGALANGVPVGREFLAESPSNPLASPSGEAAEVVALEPAPTKGYGLKKWRRIRRDMSKDVTGSCDSAQILKRRLPHVESSKGHDDDKHQNDGEDEDEDEGSVASLVSMNIGSTPLVVAATTLDPELSLLVTSAGFNIGVDSENSDDHSSKSSTAASAPRLRHEAIGFGRDRSRARTSGGKGSGHVVQQRVQRAKGGRTDATRKFRENRVKIDMENSYSSVESDLRSSNVAFVQVDTMASNGKQGEKSVNYDGEQSDDAQPSEEVRSGEVRSGFYKENGRVGDLSREDVDADLSGEENNTKSENSRPGSDLDPFLESIVSLQAAKEALENEIQKFGEIGKGKIFDDCDSQYEETEGISSPSVEDNFVELNQKMGHLECKLGEAIANVKVKESKIIELEVILKRAESLNKEIDSTNPSFLQQKCKEMEIELENLLEKKIEAEIEYLIMTKTTQSWRALAEDHIALFEEQKSLSGDQSRMRLKVKNAENNAILFEGRAEELEKDLLVTKEVLRVQSRVFKYSLCCVVQMVILCIAFGLFIMHWLPSSSGVRPT